MSDRNPESDTPPPWAGLLSQEVPPPPEEWRRQIAADIPRLTRADVARMFEVPEELLRAPHTHGIVGAVLPVPEPAPAVTRDMFLEAAKRIQAARPAPIFEVRPRQAGKTAEAVQAFMDAIGEATADVKIVLAPAKWHAILARATDEERDLLLEAHRREQIVLSEFMPEPETAYAFRMPPPERRRVPWFFR